jgi:prepilin-type processing-associated H-X9-DG protein
LSYKGWRGAPARGTKLEVTPHGFLASPEGQDEVLIGLLLPAIQDPKPRTKVIEGVRLTTDLAPTELTATAQLSGDVNLDDFNTFRIRFGSTSPNSDTQPRYNVFVEMPGSSEAEVSLDHRRVIFEGVLPNPSTALFQVDRVPDGISMSIEPEVGDRGQRSRVTSIRLTFDSAHSGGVNVLLGDGSVRFVKNSVSISTWVKNENKVSQLAIGTHTYHVTGTGKVLVSPLLGK